ncbi:MAG: hypothetical protein J6D26_03305 [Clostridia bacterium]|nr:hypothetical protein [Clostridia bacterium]
MKKSFLSLLVVLTMLISAVYVPVSASVGKLAAYDYDDIVKLYNDGTSTDNFLSVSGITASSGNLVLAGNGSTVASTLSLPVTTQTDTTYGALSFKINAQTIDSAFSTGGGVSFMVKETSSTPDVHCFIMRNTMGMTDTTSYGHNFNDGIAYNTNTWYTVGIVFYKNQTLDLYIDGAYIKNSKFANNLSSTLTSLNLQMNVIGSTTLYMDDITWSTYSDDAFFAETVGKKTAYAAGEIAKIRFTEPVAEADTSSIKLYECETGNRISGIETEFVDGILNVTLPETGMTQGKEYRIELNSIKGSLGRILKTDNIYFNYKVENSEITESIGNEDFEEFTLSTASLKGNDTDYYQPVGWYLAHRWNSQFDGFVRPVSGDASYGTAMQVGQLESTATSTNDLSETHAYMPLSKRASTGKVTITYDMKPERADDTWRNNTNPAPNLLVMVYPDGIDSSDESWAQGESASIGQWNSESRAGRIVSAIAGTNISIPAKRILGGGFTTENLTTIKTLTTDSSNVVTGDSAKWYRVKMVIDFNLGTLEYYLDGISAGTVSLSTLGINAVKGISFGTQYNSLDASTLIDNIKVEHTYESSIKTDTIKTENFSGFTTESADSPSTDTDYYQPAGWYLAHRWNGRDTGFLIPETDAQNGTVMKIGRYGNDNSGPAHGYMPLGTDITSGVVTISYSMKPERLSTAWNGVYTNHAQTPNLLVMVYPDGIDSSDMSWAQGDSVSIANTNYAKPVAGIFMNNIATANEPTWAKQTILKTLTMDTADANKVAASDSVWYDVKIELDFDNGTTAYYLDGVKTAGASLSALGIDGIQGISFGTNSNALDASTLIDNIEVKHTYEEASSIGVMQVRFSDYYGSNYGTASELTTVADTVCIAFWQKSVDTPSESNFALTDEDGNDIPFEGDYDEDTDVYYMNLREYLTKGGTYTLTVSGLTSNGKDIPAYEQTITASSEGVIIAEPMYIWKNASPATSGTVSEGDTITAGTRLINTAGTNKTYVFFMALYEGDTMYKVDFEEVEQDGISTALDKEANISCSFTMSADDAAKVTKVKTFLWDGMDTMKPVLPVAEFNKTSAQ